MKQDCIILLKGVNKNAYREVEDQFDQLLLEGSIHNDTPMMLENVYDTIPKNFTTLDNWPKSTNLHCWTCECTFTNRPIFIPLHIKSISDGSWDISTNGVFCTFSCAARHITDYVPPLYFTHLYQLYNIFYNKKVNYIYPSRKRYCTKKYGGHMTEGEYMEEIKRYENQITVEEKDSSPPPHQVIDISDDSISLWHI